MPLGLRIMQLGLGLNNLTIPFYLIKILTGHTLYPLIVLGKCQYIGTTGSSTKVIFSPCPLFFVNL